jgi:hypothetical protein
MRVAENSCVGERERERERERESVLSQSNLFVIVFVERTLSENWEQCAHFSNHMKFGTFYYVGLAIYAYIQK